MGVTALPELPWRKMLGAAAVIVLHVAIISLLLRATILHGIFGPESRETILLLPPPPKPAVKPFEPPAHRIVPAVHLPDYRGITLPETDDRNAKAPPGLGFQLFDCRIENLAMLTEEQRALCATSSNGVKPDDSVDFADHTNRAHDAMRWAREKARKNGPLLLPCASSQSIFATLSTDTILCLIHGGTGGFDLDAQPIYGERPEEVHVLNVGNPPPDYTDPDH